MTSELRARIRALNDQFRRDLQGGTILLTHGVRSLGSGFVEEALLAVARFNDFTEANDPHGEHDFGLIQIDDQSLFWKIDYFDEGLSAAADDPSNPDTCHRVMTIMLAEEY